LLDYELKKRRQQIRSSAIGEKILHNVLLCNAVNLQSDNYYQKRKLAY